ncbi:UNVERIFIED_CONTAM: hypothetical protein FKN15_029696 [Acipenser sinensis]
MNEMQDQENPGPENRELNQGDPDRVSPSQKGAGRLPLSRKLCYAIGGAPYQMTANALAFFLQLFLLDVVQCYHVPYSALNMFLGGDQRDRDSATAYRMGMEVFGTLAGATIQGQIVGVYHAKTAQTCGMLNSTELNSTSPLADTLSNTRRAYAIAAAVLCGIQIVCCLVMFLGVKEHPAPLSPLGRTKMPFFSGLTCIVKHTPYVRLVFGFLFSSLAFQLSQGNLALFCTHAAGFGAYLQHLILTFLVMATLSIPMWQFLLVKFGKKTTLFVGLSCFIPALISLASFKSSLALFFAMSAFAGSSLAVLYLLPWSMLPDVVDDFKVKNPTCTDLEPLFYSFYVFFNKFGGGVSLGISAMSLYFAGYKPGACSHKPAVITTLRVLFAPAPVVLLLLGMLIFYFYPINEERRREIKRELDKIQNNAVAQSDVLTACIITNKKMLGTPNMNEMTDLRVNGWGQGDCSKTTWLYNYTSYPNEKYPLPSMASLMEERRGGAPCRHVTSRVRARRSRPGRVGAALWIVQFSAEGRGETKWESRLRRSPPETYQAPETQGDRKMSLYPSLEDLKVDKVMKAQSSFAASTAVPAIAEEASEGAVQSGAAMMPVLYPNLQELGDYMGLSLNSDEVQRNLALLPASGNGVFIQLVQANSPASLAGLRFGDQVLQINGQNCAGWSLDKAHKALKIAAESRIELIVRDRPFQRTLTMHKDSAGHVGFIFKKGKITSIVKDSSAARNGLLTEHNICEINGQNVIGLKDSEIKDILTTSGGVITITIMPKFIYEHMVKRMASGLLKSSMDHSIPEV